MKINVLGTKSDVYRDNSIIGAIHSHTSTMSIGDTIAIDSVIDVDQTTVCEKSVRTHISIISKDTGAKYATRRRCGSLSVTRVG